MRSASFTVAAALAGLAVAAGGCGGATTAFSGHETPAPDGSADTGGGDAASGAEGGTGAGICSLDPTGAFVFHIHNRGSRMLVLSFNCGTVAPIVLTSPAGMRPIGPAAVDFCGFTCDDVYARRVQGGACGDCGGGNVAPLAPGMTFDQPWDRRTYAEITADPQCTGAASEPCAFGTRVAPVASQAGVVTVCTDGSSCTVTGGASEQIAFTVDTTQREGTIEVQ